MLLDSRCMKRVKSFIDFTRAFGFDTAVGYILMPFIRKRKGLKAKHNAVKRYLNRWSKKYNNDLTASLSNSSPKISNLESPIWVCWMQGESNMPEVVHMCYNSVLQNRNGRPVILLDATNIEKYLDIPQSIWYKLNNSKLSLTHFCDYLRASLLKNYGGYWIDATVYVTTPLQILSLEHSFLTPKLYKDGDAFVSDSRWTVSIMGSLKGSSLYCYMELLLRKYIEDHDTFIDFFLMDYLICILYERYPKINALIDNNDYNNINLYSFERLANSPFDQNVWAKLVESQCFHKLSWKSKYEKFTADGQETFIGHMLKQCKND